MAHHFAMIHHMTSTVTVPTNPHTPIQGHHNVPAHDMHSHICGGNNHPNVQPGLNIDANVHVNGGHIASHANVSIGSEHFTYSNNHHFNADSSSLSIGGHSSTSVCIGGYEMNFG